MMGGEQKMLACAKRSVAAVYNPAIIGWNVSPGNIPRKKLEKNPDWFV